jgi:hypothetical protein
MILVGVLSIESTLSAFDLTSSRLVPHLGQCASVEISNTQRRGLAASVWHCTH